MLSFTISLHTGLEPIMKRQMELLKPLEEEFIVNYNNRFHRHPGSYDSYSEMVNDAVATSKDEIVILINDRTLPTPNEVKKILGLLEAGYAAATIYSVGFIGFTKELFRTIGWWDQRFFGGGYEDDDFVLRLKLADLAYYESLEGTYDMSFKTPIRPVGGDACSKSEPIFHQKWSQSATEIKRVIPEESYPQWDSLVGERRTDISEKWKKWDQSILNINFRFPITGKSRTYWFLDDNLNQYRNVTTV